MRGDAEESLLEREPLSTSGSRLAASANVASDARLGFVPG
jgi:hypothetical protein